jgi:ketosteroid isomerase-like protein
MKIILSVLACAFLILIIGCTKQVDVRVEQAALLNADKEWAAAAKAGDIERILPFWTDDAVIYFPNVPVVSGKEAIRQFVTSNRKKSGFSLTWEPIEAVVSAAGDIGYTAGTGQLAINDSEGNLITKKMNYVCVWKKQADGSWKCPLEISNFRPSAN